MKVRLVAATRKNQLEFRTRSLLGNSLPSLLTYHPIILDLHFDNARGLPDIYNEAIERAEEDEIILFIHDDVIIDDWMLIFRLGEAMNHFDVVGVAGNRQRQARQAAWCFTDSVLTWDDRNNLSGLIAHVEKGQRKIEIFGNTPSRVKLIDGVFMAASARALKQHAVRFDTRFKFHFYDMDFCRSCEAAGLKMGTWPIALTHASAGAFGSEAWQAMYRTYLEKWRE